MNTWRVTSSEEEAYQCHATVARAKEFQTPAKANQDDITEKLDNLFFDTMEVAAPQVQRLTLLEALKIMRRSRLMLLLQVILPCHLVFRWVL